MSLVASDTEVATVLVTVPASGSDAASAGVAGVVDRTSIIAISRLQPLPDVGAAP